MGEMMNLLFRARGEDYIVLTKYFLKETSIVDIFQIALSLKDISSLCALISCAR